MPLKSKLKDRLSAIVNDHLPGLEEIYRDFHAHPELSGREKRTGALVADEFARIGLTTFAELAGYGVAGVLDNGPGPCILLRADMDALPVTEATGLPYASTVRDIGFDGRDTGVMHACGHDFHTTCLIGAAAALSELKDAFSGKVIFAAQPAEEAEGGARRMVQDGLYELAGRPDCALALHVKSDLPAGHVGLGEGVRSSASYSLDVVIRGKGGHGAAPHLTKDPVVISARFIEALQSLVSREINPTEMGVITVGAIHGGTKRNVIPAEVVLNMTVRAYDREVGDHLAEAVKRTADGIAMAAGLPEDLWPVITEAEPSYPPVVNDPDLHDRIRNLFEDFLGKDKVKDAPPSTGSEDFGEFGLVEPPLPVYMYHLGVTSPERLADAEKGGPQVSPAHDAGFYPDLEISLPTGIGSLCAAVLELMSSGKTR